MRTKRRTGCWPRSLVFMVLLLFACLCWADRNLQAEIDAAKDGGTVTLPAGVVTLKAPLVIPAGAHDLTVQGDPTGTTLYGDGDALANTPAITVGVVPQLHNNWMITGSGNVAVAACNTGQTKLKPAQPIALGYWILWDDYRIVCAKGPNVSMNHAELVRVTAYDAASGTATVDKPIGREYGPNAWLCPYEKATCRRVTVKNLAFNGLGAGGKVSRALVMVGISDRVTLSHLTVRNFQSDAIACNTARNVNMDHLDVQGAASGDAGAGYAVSVYRSRFVNITDSRASQSRHSFMLHSGAMDVLVFRCDSQNGFDTHGYDERRVAFVNCTGDGGDIGNDAWLGGARDVLVKGCTFREPLGLHANVKGVRVVDTTLGGLAFYSVEPGTTPTVGVPAGGLADGIRVDRCKILGTITTLGASRTGAFSMYGGSIERYGTLIDLANGPTPGTWLFQNVALKNGPEQTVQLRNQGPGFSFTMQGCTFTTEARTCVWVASSFSGVAKFLGCIFPAGKTAIADQSAPGTVTVTK